MQTLDFDVREDGQRAVEHNGVRYVIQPLPETESGDLRDVVAAVLPTMSADVLADFSFAQLVAVRQIATLVREEATSSIPAAGEPIRKARPRVSGVEG